ncbi:hypothetical protein [uncultured Eudoraea sp.]|nr:hypothetical protein [uncultured Eudoraea sp.]
MKQYLRIEFYFNNQTYVRNLYKENKGEITIGEIAQINGGGTSVVKVKP